jgi:hypothetical protein
MGRQKFSIYLQILLNLIIFLQKIKNYIYAVFTVVENYFLASVVHS